MRPIEIPGLGIEGPPLSPDLDRAVQEAIRAELLTEPKPQPAFRVGPDLTFLVELEEGTQRTFELVADGAYLRDPETHRLWPFSLGKRMLVEVALRQGLGDESSEP